MVPLIAAKDPRLKSVYDIPQFAATDLQLRGLNLPTSMLAGFGVPEIEKLRDQADRAGCPILLIVEDTPIDFTERGPAWLKSLDRLGRLGIAASRLGCPSIAIRAAAPDTDEAFDATAAGVKVALKSLDRHEINLLLVPHTGLTFDAGRLTDLIKKIGGFRIGCYPSFGHAFETGDLERTLRKLAPYGSSMSASVRGFDKEGVHEGYLLETCVDAIRSVGYANTLALDYVGMPAVAGKKRKVDIVADLDMARAILEAKTMEEEVGLLGELEGED